MYYLTYNKYKHRLIQHVLSNIQHRIEHNNNKDGGPCCYFLFIFLCCPIMCLYVLSPALWCWVTICGVKDFGKNYRSSVSMGNVLTLSKICIRI